ncbi:hypothetical protein CEUSTIGMA_g6203.t1 [Chlamydomonas eustigma]|uniref:Uncharacterized protein n=1 Tax=Chlamydomonas eustigma TaxID=1157962 RepID=A0A250X6U4_9CHLO|nr:hypothetical protein CEUSTIGMA_g6203.t1 [Chlamydomonas eustigma]|eukprot:GAX78766.1 hypothetical protein CEUSTIGMA_g6203.t1 [Chlamydomonas eustigma]
MPKDVHDGASVKKNVHSLLMPMDVFGLKKLTDSVLLSLNSAAILVMQSMDELSQLCSSASNSGMTSSSHHDRHESLASALEASKRLIHTASDILSTITTTISCQQPHEQGPASVGSTASSGGSADTANHKTLLMMTDVSDSCDRPETVNGGILQKGRTQ